MTDHPPSPASGASGDGTELPSGGEPSPPVPAPVDAADRDRLPGDPVPADTETSVFVADEQTDEPVDTGRWARLAEGVLAAEGIIGDAELSVLFVDEAAIAELNKRFLGKDGPTDVLAFPIDDEPVEAGRSPDSGGAGPGWTAPEASDLPTLIGDVVICPAVAARNAPDHAGTYDDELALLIVHGILHLLGMDHEEDDEAEAMEAKEQQLLDRLHRNR